MKTDYILFFFWGTLTKFCYWQKFICQMAGSLNTNKTILILVQSILINTITGNTKKQQQQQAAYRNTARRKCTIVQREFPKIRSSNNNEFKLYWALCDEFTVMNSNIHVNWGVNTSDENVLIAQIWRWKWIFFGFIHLIVLSMPNNACLLCINIFFFKQKKTSILNDQWT